MVKKIRAFLGFFWAALALPLMLATFIGNDIFAKNFVNVTGLSISPRITGGEVVRTITHPHYQTLIHRPVFDGLFCDRPLGILQVDLMATGSTLPKLINEIIDYNEDGKADFRIIMNTESNQFTMTPFNPNVIKTDNFYKLEKQRTLRLLLKKGYGE